MARKNDRGREDTTRLEKKIRQAVQSRGYPIVLNTALVVIGAATLLYAIVYVPDARAALVFPSLTMLVGVLNIFVVLSLLWVRASGVERADAVVSLLDALVIKGRMALIEFTFLWMVFQVTTIAIGSGRFTPQTELTFWFGLGMTGFCGFVATITVPFLEVVESDRGDTERDPESSNDSETSVQGFELDREKPNHSG